MTAGVSEAAQLEAIADEKRAQVGLVDALRRAAPPKFRWHLCCPTCRLVGHQGNCRDCRDGKREDFAAPLPGDFLCLACRTGQGECRCGAGGAVILP